MPSEDAKLVLVVDDEPRMINFIRMNLELESFRVVSAENGLEAVKRARELLPDCVLLDVMMPEMDGFETLRAIREESSTPVIMLTARSDEDDKVRGLNLGADDYITKPFSPRELVSRVKAVVRRSELPSQVDKAPIRVDEHLQVDFNRREVIVGGTTVKLRPTEWRLLYHLMQNAGWVVPHETLLSKVWGWEYRDETQYLRLYITYLRQKIEPDMQHPRYIMTERGTGYRFVDYKTKPKG
ncbi:MAG TPA: response regulator transcription factor [Thermoflexales bacterium]|jgi:two-component system KDP operon response regulator KdpE|nr:response regulator transcription factor [Anaerolineae bacterium]HQV26768.1 response regulator transcription factor [Thermoflexales bacterium]HQX09809.1 response regulator transcription factor [Thermoflexales bacterium]HQY23515.1 response regulator transcription factor [Thermoflexales bacterium]HQZ52230.1 response regulator transcription factor [Thermoflexales bacterium]